MTTKTVNLYEFNELSEAAKEKARDWWRECNNHDTFWSECTIDEAKEQAENMGLDIDNIYWRGFSSQGDGACYEGTWHACDVKAGETAKGWGDCDATKEIRRIAAEFEETAKNFPNASFRVKHRGHYSHEFCTTFDVSLGEEEDDLENLSQEEWSRAEEDLIETARDYMRWIYRQLEKEYEYQNSAECIDENLTANSYSFLEDGTRED
jgi:hypothetical protein